MPVIQSAKKALRGSQRKRVFNLRRSRAMKDAVKDVRGAVAAGDAKAASEKLPVAYQALDKAAKRGIIKQNSASRTKSRLSKLVKDAKGK